MFKFQVLAYLDVNPDNPENPENPENPDKKKNEAFEKIKF
jgi:hypothetical protein